MSNYEEVTELAGDNVSQEQIERVVRRYFWALDFSKNKDVLEVACGTGPGLGLLKNVAKSLIACDISDSILSHARLHYGDRIDIRRMDAANIPLEDKSLDVIIIFEALYYIEKVEDFVSQCARLLRPGGIILISNANKDLFDFNPSPYSYVYHGVVELRELFTHHGFYCEFWGDVLTKNISLRQKILRPIKKTVVSLGLMPKSMSGKKLLKRIIFGKMEKFPNEILLSDLSNIDASLTLLESEGPNRDYKVILCAARILV